MEHLQEELYKQIKEEKGTVTIFLKSGVRIIGEVVGVNKFTVLILVDGKQQLISLLLACFNINAGSN
ncbi:MULTISPECIES: RNA chaperone Hfq [Bacillus]|uniref:RNA-binding protein Hfq n=1 Tax=Bacillus cereus TaxID=1396 RepID=A0A9X6BCX7_BACCE|nr:RNA chaperone Hfq [Bacillus cereus]OOR76925.1 RNA-binding protein Hfq [Bacillus cereus]